MKSKHAALLKRPIAFHPIFADIGGSINAGLMLSQLYYWSDHLGPNKWIFKTQEQWFSETRLTRHAQQAAADNLQKLGLIEVERIGKWRRNHYRINTTNFDKALAYVSRNPVDMKSYVDRNPVDRNPVDRKAVDRNSALVSAEKRSTPRRRYIGTRAESTLKSTNTKANTPTPTPTPQAARGSAVNHHAASVSPPNGKPPKPPTPRQKRIADALAVFEVQLVMRMCAWTDQNLAPVIHESLEQHRRREGISIAESAKLMVGNWNQYAADAKYLRYSYAPRNWIKQGHWCKPDSWPIDWQRIEHDQNKRIGVN
jgi:hypothetical protein